MSCACQPTKINRQAQLVEVARHGSTMILACLRGGAKKAHVASRLHALASLPKLVPAGDARCRNTTASSPNPNKHLSCGSCSSQRYASQWWVSRSLRSLRGSVFVAFRSVRLRFGSTACQFLQRFPASSKFANGPVQVALH